MAPLTFLAPTPLRLALTISTPTSHRTFNKRRVPHTIPSHPSSHVPRHGSTTSCTPSISTSTPTPTPISVVVDTPTSPPPPSSPFRRRASTLRQATLSTDIAAAAAAATTLSLTMLCVPPPHTDAAAHPSPSSSYPSTAVTMTHHDMYRPVSSTTMSSSTSSLPSVHTPLAVIGVAKSAIHDYDSPTSISSMVVTPVAPTVTAQPVRPPVPMSADEARREFALSARLITAVVTGVLIGVERRATQLNLGVRSVTLLSLTAALVSVMASVAVSPISVPVGLVTAVPVLAVAGVALLSGGGVFAATRMRRRSTRNARAMSVVVGLAVGMGFACGSGMGLATAGLYLAAVATMRGDAARGTMTGARWRADGSGEVGGRPVVDSGDGVEMGMRAATASTGPVDGV